MAEPDKSHVAAFVGHLLTNEAVRTKAAEAKSAAPEKQSEAITKVINDHIGTNLNPEEGQAVANESKKVLDSLVASPKTVSDAGANIITR